MALNTLSKLLKKKKLTGEEVGKIILLDLVNRYKGQPTLTQVERDAYVDSLIENKDIRDYNDYLQIYRMMQGFASDFERFTAIYAHVRAQFIFYLIRLQDAESKYFSLSLQPRIVTRRDYEQALNEAKENVSSWKYSLYNLVSYELHKNIEAYNNKEKTPYKRYFDAYKKEQASKEAIEGYRATYYQSKDNPKKDKELTKLVMLDDYLEIYNDAELETKGGMLFFKDDYPELLQSILENYSQLEGLEYLANLNTDDHIREDLIDFATAYKLDILGAKKDYDDPLLSFNGCDLLSGVAVIETVRGLTKGKIIDGTFYYDLSKGQGRGLSEDVLADKKHIAKIEDIKRQFKQTLRNLQALQYFMLKLVEITGVPDLLIFSKSDGTEKIQYFNALVEDMSIVRYGLLKDEGDPRKLENEIKELYGLGFTVDDIQIKEEEKAKVEEIINNSSSREKAVVRVFNYLLTGDESNG